MVVDRALSYWKMCQEFQRLPTDARINYVNYLVIPRLQAETDPVLIPRMERLAARIPMAVAG